MTRKRGKSKEAVTDSLFFSILTGVLLISLGVFLVGQFHSRLGVFSLAIGSALLYISVIVLVFKL